MAEVRLSEDAKADLEDIRSAGVATFGEPVAERHLRAIRQGLELLSKFPFAGQERPEFRQAMRSISRRPHRILYTVHDDVVIVVRVLHQARDVVRALGELH